MPTVGVKAELLFKRLEQRYTEDEFQDLCFAFGLELDDVTSEKEMLEKMSKKEAADASEEVIYKIDIPANRYDLLCLEGIARALRIFLGKDPSPLYTLAEPAGGRQKLVITPETQDVRPFAVAAVLRGVTLNQDSYDSFIDLQEKLHKNICRERTLVAIGTHDLDTIQGPFVYNAQKPEDITFRPLRASEDREWRADELLVDYEKDLQLRDYVPIIKGKPRFPIIRDSNGVVLSMPPIINGHHSKITLGTKNVFIECTATDLTKAKIVLNMVVCMFTEYCEKPFAIEPVDVQNPDGTVVTYPDLSSRTETVDTELLCRRIGIECETPKLADMLTRMDLSSVVVDEKTLHVTIPPTRSDIIHACDIWEDAAIGYGYNNIKRVDPSVATYGKQQPVNQLSDQLRVVIAEAGYSEALTFALCARVDAFDFLRREDDGKTAAVITNPVNKDFQIVRVNLLSGLLKTVAENKQMPLPIKVFEISDVVLLDPTSETGAVNNRRCAALIYAKSPCFEEIQGLVDYIMKQLGMPRVSRTADKETKKTGYYVRETDDPAFFGELGAAEVVCRGQIIGVFGVVHPEVLLNYDIPFPCGALEIDLASFIPESS
mmetsp:Transcript_25372/g.66358  ORF Transcript_25372/g.66358 Transcript_25372/m.66358 type:complete len:602 (+) Transcript_25372:52-1857(+)